MSKRFGGYGKESFGVRAGIVVVVNPLLLFLTFSALVANPKKTTLHGGQSRSRSAEQGKKINNNLAAFPPPPPPRAARSVKINQK